MTHRTATPRSSTNDDLLRAPDLGWSEDGNGRSIDEMLERLDRSFDARRRFVADASHELRTPLAVNRTMLEVAAGNPDVSDDLEQLAPRLLATNERSERLVDGLLTLARSEIAAVERTPIDLAEVAAVTVDHERADAQDTDHGRSRAVAVAPPHVRTLRMLRPGPRQCARAE